PTRLPHAEPLPQYAAKRARGASGAMPLLPHARPPGARLPSRCLRHHAAERRVTATHALHVALVHRTTILPALEHPVPADLAARKVPPLRIRVVLAGERIIEHVLLRLIAPVRRHLESETLAQRHRRAHPDLAQLIIRQPFQPILELAAVPLHVVGQPEPLDRHGEHPVDGALQLLARLTARLRQPLHPHLAVAKVEGLLEVDLHQRTLQRTIAGVLVYVGEQRDARAVEETVRGDQLRPALERLIEAIRVLELVRLAAVDELLLVEAHVLEE